MLVILYGATAEMGHKSRAYLEAKGFKKIDKIYFVPEKAKVTTLYDERNIVSESEFFEVTDSLFRYKIAGMIAGVNQELVSEAVHNKTNRLLTLSTDDINDVDFLARIKSVYEDNVCLIYTYIDDESLAKIISSLNISDDEKNERLKIGQSVKESYLQYQQIFDYVVMYSGEGTSFDFNSLYRQFDGIIDKVFHQDEKLNYSDVFISFSQKDKMVYNRIKEGLNANGISVYDYRLIASGKEYMVAIREAIREAKIFVSVITENSLSSDWCMNEMQYSFECAEQYGTVLITVMEDLNDFERVPLFIREKSKKYASVIIEKDNFDEVVNIVHKLFSAENQLKMYSKQIDDYLCLKMFEQAELLQRDCLKICDEVYSISRGTFISEEACVLSRIKLIDILLDMSLYNEAIESVTEALNMLDSGDLYDILVEQLMLSCAFLKMEEDQVKDLILNNLNEFQDCDVDQNRVIFEKFIVRFRSAVKIVETTCKPPEEGLVISGDEDKIAQYGQWILDLFENLINDNEKYLTRHDLIIGYGRVLNYCKHIGLKGKVADRCISRITELSSFDDSSVEAPKTTTVSALKLYLGQALPETGNYDVFISYKSEDLAIAQKVYDYLKRNGKEVFFAKETLPILGDSEYEKRIFEAIENTKHMVLVGSNPDYFKTSWVETEWSTFKSEKRAGRKIGNLLLLLTDDIAQAQERLPNQLRQTEVIKLSELNKRLLPYLR